MDERDQFSPPASSKNRVSFLARNSVAVAPSFAIAQIIALLEKVTESGRRPHAVAACNCDTGGAVSDAFRENANSGDPVGEPYKYFAGASVFPLRRGFREALPH